MSKKSMIKELDINWEAVADGLIEYKHIIQDIAIIPNISKKEYNKSIEVLDELIEHIRNGEIEEVISKKRLENFLLEKEDEENFLAERDEEDYPFR